MRSPALQFFQAAGLQAPGHGAHQESVTRVRLEALPAGALATLGIGDEWRPAVLVRDAGVLRWRWASGDEA